MRRPRPLAARRRVGTWLSVALADGKGYQLALFGTLALSGFAFGLSVLLLGLPFALPPPRYQHPWLHELIDTVRLFVPHREDMPRSLLVMFLAPPVGAVATAFVYALMEVRAATQPVVKSARAGALVGGEPGEMLA